MYGQEHTAEEVMATEVAEFSACSSSPDAAVRGGKRVVSCGR